MCGRFTQQRPTAELARLFDAELLVDEPGGRYNVAPMQKVAVVVQKEEHRALTAYRWGLVPSWAKDPKIGSRMINARAETVATSPAFRDSFRRRRCIVPADAFYEWQRLAGTRQPYAIRRRDGQPLAFAGLWSSWRVPELPEPLRTFTIITTTPNELMAELHDRMPVILPRDAWSLWLDPQPGDVGELHGLLVPSPAGELEAFAVAPLVNSTRNQGPELIAPLPA
jgi:putative SOS response-associated peptidase YedK